MHKLVTSLVASAFLSAIVLVHAEDAPTRAEASTDAVTGTLPDGTVNLTGGAVAAGIGY